MAVVSFVVSSVGTVVSIATDVVSAVVVDTYIKIVPINILLTLSFN